MDSGGLFFLFLHTSNEIISGEKPLLTFLSNLSRSLLRLYPLGYSPAPLLLGLPMGPRPGCSGLCPERNGLPSEVEVDTPP